MNCNHVQNLISAFIDDELTPQEKRDLRRHLFFCPECHSEYQSFLRLKDYLNDLHEEPCGFDPLAGFRLRVAEAEQSFLPEVNRLLLFGRLGLVAGCVTLFFMSTVALFPNKVPGGKLAQNTPSQSELAPAAMSASEQRLETPVSIDQNFSLDEPVTVYQASLIIP